MSNGKRVLILGGYGNFGRYIAKVLGQNPNVQLIIAGRHPKKGEALLETLTLANQAKAIYCDIHQTLAKTLARVNPHIVIHTSGPFQGQDYRVVEACIHQGCHYIDLSDSREFVMGIRQFNDIAMQKKLLICSGASSVPALSAAVIDHYITKFSVLESVDYAIATAQLTNQGLATTAGVLSYAGKPFMSLKEGKFQPVYGWQDIRLRPFWQLKKRLLGNCDIPDLGLFPEYYPQLKTIRFQAGLELKFLQLILFFLSWLVRLHLFPSLDKCARGLLAISHGFNYFGHDDTGFYMDLVGLDHQKKSQRICFEIYAHDGDGLYIPCIPAILLTEQLCEESSHTIGATPCIGHIRLTDYLDKLSQLQLKIQCREQRFPN